MKFKTIDIPENVIKIGNILNKNEFQAFVVGGAVRDLLLHKPIHDWDIASNATPKEVIEIFKAEKIKTIPTGEQYGTITIHLNGEDYEVTTFRQDANYEDFRRPTAVSFSKSIEEDLSRRDFTINSLAINLKTGDLIDPFGGQNDLKEKIIRAVGRPFERFKEDALRLMRAIRFATRFGFEIDEDTKRAIKRNAERLRYVSNERIKAELDGILLSPKPSVGFQLLHDLGLLKIILPEVDILDTVPQQSPWHHKNVFGHTMDVVDASPARLDVRWATLLHDTGKLEARTRDEAGRDRFIGHDRISAEIADKVLRRLKFDNASRAKIVKLIFLHQAEPLKRHKMKAFIRHLGVENLEDWKAMRVADITAHKPEKVEHGMQIHGERVAVLDDILANNEPYDVSHLAIGGDELIKIGVAPGPVIGKVLKGMLDIVISHPEKNTKEFLTGWARNNWRRLEKEINKGGK